MLHARSRLSVAGVLVVFGGSSGCDAAPSCTPSSASRPAVPDSGAAALGPGPGGSCDFPHDRAIAVSSADALRAALNDARPGDRIELANGTYPGHFELTLSGTATAPIVICGGRGALLDGGALDTGYTLHLAASHVTLSGFTVAHGASKATDTSSRTTMAPTRQPTGSKSRLRAQAAAMTMSFDATPPRSMGPGSAST